MMMILIMIRKRGLANIMSRIMMRVNRIMMISYKYYNDDDNEDHENYHDENEAVTRERFNRSLLSYPTIECLTE